ncbi:hypothetical protein BSKO_00840 [Bryopsis sp. KO-2023]|nr:hypothetical protein BSKO_00840 [Bryopsis sp. KO-2023]
MEARSAAVCLLMVVSLAAPGFADTTLTLMLIKPDALDKAEEIKHELAGSGFSILNYHECSLDGEAIAQFYAEHKGKSFFNELLGYMGGRQLAAMVLEGDNAVTRIRDMLGPTDPTQARQTHPSSLRARFGKTMTANGIHASDSEEAALREIEYFFPSRAKEMKAEMKDEL